MPNFDSWVAPLKKIFALSSACRRMIPKDKLLPPKEGVHNVVLLSCGSFSPITFMHLRLFPICRDHMNNNGHFVRGCYISPVHDAYGKKDLVASEDRLTMCRLAAEGSPYIMVSDWEAYQGGWTETKKVIEKFSEVVNDGEAVHTDVVLVCGSDLLNSFNTPDLWTEEDMRYICSEGICCVQRQGVSVEALGATNALLGEYFAAGKILAVTPTVENNVSSTLVRAAVRAGQDIYFLTPNSVADYIKEKQLWLTPGTGQ